ncbi:MAG: M20/M25/M40 family metallo-hydrolase [Ferruginibacter sp.]|nr:M20/M25/M40 family metallo-hydrolase [Cytophagales bacterium]
MKILLSASLLGLSFAAPAQPSNIQPTEVARLVKTLSADAMQGRRSFEPGSLVAAQFIAEEFRKIGLVPLPGLSGYEQTFRVYRTQPGTPAVTLNGEVVSEANVMVSTGKPSLQWANTDHQPAEIATIAANDNFPEKWSRLRQGSQNTLILVHPDHAAPFRRYQEFLSRGSVQMATQDQGNHVCILTESATATAYQVKLVNRVDTLQLQNVVGTLPGKKRRLETVIFSGHYDHLGFLPPVNGDSIANGADDDASGTTAVIALAQHFKKLGNNQRTLVFVAFTAEEIGGYGSKYFSERMNPDQVVAMFNIEMIGKRARFGPNTAWITGFEKTDFGKILQKNLRGSPYTFHPDPYPDQNLFYRSDNATLARQGVPAHSISTDEIDVDKLYHSVDDEFESLDVASMTSVIRAIARSATSIIAGKDTPTRVNTEALKK